MHYKRRLLTVVKVFVRTLFNKGLIAVDSLARIELPSVGYVLPKALFSIGEVERILDQPLIFGLKGLCDRAILETFFATGIRRTELLHLTLADVNFLAQQ